MNELGVVLSPAKYYEEAKRMLEKRDLVGFLLNIGVAIESANGNKEMLADASFLQVDGLMKFKHHTKVLECIPFAIKHNEGLKVFRLKQFEGVAKGFLGHITEAKSIFRELLEKANTDIDIVRICVDLAWAYLTLSKDDLNDIKLNEVKGFLKKATECINSIPDEVKRKVYNSYGIYYFYAKEYDKAIEFINKSFEISEEKDYAKLYNNLAQIYLTMEKNCVVEEVREYTQKAELIATKYKDTLEMGKAFYTQAQADLRNEQLFTALDTLYMAFDYFKDAEAIAYAFDCLVLINDTINNYKAECMETLQHKLRKGLKDTPYEQNI